MAETSLDLTVSTPHARSRGRSIVSFFTASLLQLGGFAFLVVAPLFTISQPPPPRVQPPGLVVGVIPPVSLPASVVPPMRRRVAPKAPDVSRFEWFAPSTIPDQIPDPFGAEAIGDVGSPGGGEWFPWAPTSGAPSVASPIKDPKPIRPGGQIQPPRKTKHVDPVYPELARAVRIDGVVILEAVIDIEGRVQNVKILRSIPFLDESAVTAVERWEYEPTLLNGVPVPVVITVTVRFVSEVNR